ncbi:MAG: hypothetical protein Q4P20_00910 [Eubacteriales bacterium]|nr:hypothetical protein [Eubacteriales bacterium]
MKVKNTRVIGVVALILSTFLILFDIHHLEVELASPEYKAKQFLAQYGWSAGQIEKRSSTLCDTFVGEYAIILPEEIEQANAAVGFPANMDFLTQETPMVYLANNLTYLETQTDLFYNGTNPPDNDMAYAWTYYGIYCFFDPHSSELTGAFLYRFCTDSQQGAVYPLTLSAEEVTALPQ